MLLKMMVIGPGLVKGRINHCKLCGATRHTQRACPLKEEGFASGVSTPNRSTRGEQGLPKVSTPSSPTIGFEVSISGGVRKRGAGVRMTSSGVRIRGGACNTPKMGRSGILSGSVTS
ncbi:hypothetical protein Tco_0569458 [Tanacetum coccineum]